MRPAAEDGRDDELVGDPGRVARADRLDRIGGLDTLAVDDRVEGELRPLPALVAVHRVVAAGDGGDPLGRELGEVAHGARAARRRARR